MGLPATTDHINATDDVMIVQDGCIRMVNYEEFIKNISLGGFTICQAVLNCWDGMGDFDNTPVHTDTPPVFADLIYNVDNRGVKVLASDDFISHFSDADNDQLARVVITGGNLIGVKFKGQPVAVGQVIGVADIGSLEYDAKDTDDAYQQFVEIEVYDENNVQAQ